MQKHNYILLVAFTICFVTLSFSQHRRYAIKNGIGIQAGITQYDISTDNFSTTKSDGWLGGMLATVDLPHRIYTVSFGMQLSDNKMEILGSASSDMSDVKAVEYKLMAVQVGFLFHLKVFDELIMLEAGPQIQYNSKLQLTSDTQENYFISGYNNLKANEIEDINKFNFNGVGGVSLGLGAIKIRAHYIHGFTNILNKLNDADFNTNLKAKFKGNQAMTAFSIVIVF
ncbi:MAG: hypothetical protein HKO92_03995 [Flavobacteriaceae bacterium]|nr:PorT family protein [Bacteroidia bacterium]NNK82265.1 hypothetical protein [Flavobacteriaceae bacterium]